MQFHSHSFDDTVECGKKFGCSLKGGEVIILSGELGSGKTAFAKGIALALGIYETVTSPSFSILNEYSGHINLFHFDFYRLEDESEIEDLLEDYVYRKGGVTVIEWGEKILEKLQIYILIQFRFINTARLITIKRRDG